MAPGVLDRKAEGEDFMAYNGELNGHPLGMADADVILFPAFFAVAEADGLFAALTDGIAWKQDTIKLYGRVMDQPRLTAWYGDAGRSYTYSGITMSPQPWTPELLQIRQQVETVAGVVFNSVLLNQYRDERDSVSWHSDDEPELGVNPVIASVSFGAARRFQFKHKADPEKRVAVDLTHGSLLLMRGPTQHFWKHQIPKSSRPHGPRINLTFRVVG
jgi:alkylated DNA repair dioxygenase AlkB